MTQRQSRPLHRGFGVFVFLAILTIFVAVSCIEWIATSYVPHSIDRDIALEVYGSQIQLFTIFAALTPIFYVFYQTRERPQLRMIWATIYACLEIVFSMGGIASVSYSLILGHFDASSVILPFCFVAILVGTLVFYLLLVGGFVPVK